MSAASECCIAASESDRAGASGIKQIVPAEPLWHVSTLWSRSSRSWLPTTEHARYLYTVCHRHWLTLLLAHIITEKLLSSGSFGALTISSPITISGADNLNSKMMMGCADFLVPLDEPQTSAQGQLPVAPERQLPLLHGRRESEVYKLDGWSGGTPRPQQQDAPPQLRQTLSNIKVGNVQAVPSDIVAYSSNAPRQRRCLCVWVWV